MRRNRRWRRLEVEGMGMGDEQEMTRRLSLEKESGGGTRQFPIATWPKLASAVDWIASGRGPCKSARAADATGCGMFDKTHPGTP